MGTSELHTGYEPSDENQRLNVAFRNASNHTKHSRSISLASSTHTTVGQSPIDDQKFTAIKRRQTQVPIVELTWLDCVRGFLFGPTGLKRKLAATVTLAELEDAGPEMFDHKEVPFILTVAVYSNDGDGQRHEGKCVLDTGCLQGNIISATFARRLGFTEYLPLKKREEPGGTVATGNIHKVSGAVHVSWYSTTSPKVFRDMRFLVSESAQVDLVVGTHSIVRHNLISPPNLGAEMNEESNTTREDLAQEEGDLRTKLEDAPKGTSEHEKIEKKHKIANLRLELYDATKRVADETKPELKKPLQTVKEGLEAELKKLKGKKGKEGKKSDSKEQKANNDEKETK